MVKTIKHTSHYNIYKIKFDAPFVVTETTGQYDVNVNATGGGIKGQAEAIKMGIALALCEVDENLRPALKKAGMLRRDCSCS